MRKSEHKIQRVARGGLDIDSYSENVENFAGNPTHCRTGLRHTAEGRNN